MLKAILFGALTLAVVATPTHAGPSCDPDIDMSGDVDTSDLLSLLAAIVGSCDLFGLWAGSNGRGRFCSERLVALECSAAEYSGGIGYHSDSGSQ